MSNTYLPLQFIAENGAFDDVEDMMDFYDEETKVPACCEHECLVGRGEKCKHGNLSIFLEHKKEEERED